MCEGPLKGDQVGALQCDYILHMVGPHNAANAAIVPGSPLAKW